MKQHKFCRKPFNEHSYHVRFQFAKWFQRRRLKSKILDNGCQVRAICHTTFIFFIQSCHTPRCPSFFLGFPHPLKRVIQLCDTNQEHNSDEGCNGHVRYCCNLASIVLCKLSQLNLSETTGLNGTKPFLEN